MKRAQGRARQRAKPPERSEQEVRDWRDPFKSGSWLRPFFTEGLFYFKDQYFSQIRVSEASAPPGEKGARTRPTASEAGPEGANRKFATGGTRSSRVVGFKLLAIREFFCF